VVIRRVFLAVELKRCRLVVDSCSRGDDGLHAINGIVESRGVHKWFEYRAWLATRQRMIELALPVVASANDRFDLAGPRIKRDQRDLRLRDSVVAALLGLVAFPLLVFLRQEHVHILHPYIDSGHGYALQSGVERRIHAEI